MAPALVVKPSAFPCHTNTLQFSVNEEISCRLDLPSGSWNRSSGLGNSQSVADRTGYTNFSRCKGPDRLSRVLPAPSACQRSSTEENTARVQDTKATLTSVRESAQGPCSNANCPQKGNAMSRRRCTRKPCLEGLANAAKYVRNDANLLARQFARLDERARQDVALLGSRILILDARARKDAEKLDTGARNNVQRLRHVALGLEESVSVAAMEHWNDGQLDADLRLADLRARRRALEDSFAAMQILRMVHKAVANVLLLREAQREEGVFGVPGGRRTSVLDGSRALDSTGLDGQPWHTPSPTDRLLALEEAYRTMLSTASDVDALEYVDSDELEFIVAALVDLDEVGGANGASLVTEAANSPDAATRRALANALSAAPSVWALGNAGIGALQRLSEDSNPMVAEAASQALEDLQSQLSQQATSPPLLRFPTDLGSDIGLAPDLNSPQSYLNSGNSETFLWDTFRNGLDGLNGIVEDGEDNWGAYSNSDFFFPSAGKEEDIRSYPSDEDLDGPDLQDPDEGPLN